MKKAWQFYYEEYLDNLSNDVNEELDARLKELLTSEQFETIQELLAQTEAKIEESAFEAGFKCGSCSK